MSLIEAALEKARQAQEKARAEEQARVEKLRNAARQESELQALPEETKTEILGPVCIEEISDLQGLPAPGQKDAFSIRDIEIPKVIFYAAIVLAVVFAVYFCWLLLRPEKQIAGSVQVKHVLANSAVVNARAESQGGLRHVAGKPGGYTAKNLKYTLTGITTSGTDRLALINDKVLGLGDSLDAETTVVYIGENSVVLSIRGQDVELTLS